MTEAQEKLIEALEAAGVREVTLRLARSEYGAPETHAYILVDNWLRLKASEGNAEALATAREANSVARAADVTASEALRIARRDHIIAIVAATAAVIAAIAGVIAAIASIIGLFH